MVFRKFISYFLFVSSLDSFENIRAKWYPEVRHHCPDVPIILVGTKKDLRDEQEGKQRSSKEMQRSHSKEYIKKRHLQKSQSVMSNSSYTIDAETAKALANDLYNVVNYVECSAKTGEGVKEVFEEGIRAVVSPKVDVIIKQRKCTLF